MLLGTFHERQGDQYLLHPKTEGVWGRAIGVSFDQKFTGLLSPSYNGTLWGLQVGGDVFESDDKVDRAGPFFTYARSNGTVRGTILDIKNAVAGSLPMNVYSLGGYYTHFGENGWYADAILMGSWYRSHPQSVRGIGTDINGNGLTISLEGGYPFELNEKYTLEPMAQIIYSTLSFGPASDPYTTLEFHADSNWTGRLGARLERKSELWDAPAKPFLEVNLWHSFGGTDITIYNDKIPIAVPFGNTDLQLAAGISSQVSESFSVTARVSYLFEISGNYQRAIEGNVDIRYTW